jgi:GT2 family glycosyltransferase
LFLIYYRLYKNIKAIFIEGLILIVVCGGLAPECGKNMSVTRSTEATSVIICTYTQERWDDLTRAVASIRKQTCPAQEIIVVIDHNQQLLAKAQRELLDVQVIENTEKRGLSGARNSGIATACGTFIAFMDDDAVAEPDWLLHMHMALSCSHRACPDGRIGASGQGQAAVPTSPYGPDSFALGVGSAVLPVWEDQEPSWFPAEFYWVVGCSYRGMPSVSAPIRNPIGAGMCIRREVFQAVGGFRSEIGRIGALPVGCEETELCIRARQRWPERHFFYIPQVHVEHYIPRERGTWCYFQARCYAEGISKAVVARLVGTKDALSSESTYALKTLSTGILCNIRFALINRRFSYVLRALAIVAGLCITTIGYLMGKYALLSAVENVEVASKLMSSSGKREVEV